jgi:glycosyltransferase involved in cell wall biosynthesis
MQPLDITICIPTYNRSAILDETLRRLYDSPIQFRKVMVSDNASTDDTARVLEKYKAQNANFDFKINRTNIGPLNNFHSLLSVSDTKFQYLLSDDDFIHHENIRDSVEYLEENDFISALYGDYLYELKELDEHFHALKALDPGAGYVEAGGKYYKTFNYYKDIILFDKDNFLDQVQISSMIHPIFRTEAYKRYCYFDEYSFGFWRVMLQLLKYGPFIYNPIPLFYHQATDSRMELQVHSPWYFGQMLADFEGMLAEWDEPLTPEARQLMLAKIQPRHFEYGYNDAVWRLQDPLLSRQYLTRLKAHGAVKPHLEQEWRQMMLIPAIAKQLAALAASSQKRDIQVQASIPNAVGLAKALRKEVGDQPIDLLSVEALADGFIVFESWDDLQRYRAEHELSNRDCAVFEDVKNLLDIF